ncbi:MAG: oxygenase MpaB family protein [Acidimicrobiia bacterium]
MAPVPSVGNVRDALAHAVRSRLGGPNGGRRFLELVTESGPRWFADDRPIRTVHADTSMFIGGLRALLLQTLHPLAMAGVAEHSDYRSDPWGRLQRTADYITATTFGTSEAAEATVRHVRAVHRRVHGTAPDGRPYSASDPHLLRWVHLVEVDSFLRAHQAFGARPLDQPGRDGYVEDMAVVARKLGVPAPPTSERGLKDQLRVFRPELRGTREAREAVRYLLLSPPLPLAARAPYAALGAAAVALLPRWARWPLRLPNLPVLEAVAVTPAADLTMRALRWSLTADRERPAS